MEDEGIRRPTEGLSRVGMLAAGELDVEAAAEFTGLGRRSSAERTDGRIAGPAAHPPQLLHEHELEDHLGLGGHLPVSVEDEDQIPVVSAEFEAPGADAADGGAGARRFEPQVRLEPKELWRKDPAERQAEARPDDLHHEGRTRRGPRDDGGDRTVRPIDDEGEADDDGKTDQQRQRETVFRKRILPFIEDFDGLWQGFVDEMLGRYEGLKALDLEQATGVELLAHFEDTIATCRRMWEIHMYMMYGTYTAYILFEELCRELAGIDDASPQFHALVSGFDNKVFQVDRRLWEFANQARALAIAAFHFAGPPLASYSARRIFSAAICSGLADRLPMPRQPLEITNTACASICIAT